MADSPGESRDLPLEPIHRLTTPLRRFLHIEAASGVVLLLAAVTAFALANSPLADGFLGIWKTPLTIGLGDFQMSHSLKHWINDGLMTVFFFVIGLEVKRELAVGELRDVRRAALPVVAALGGMIVPAAFYLALQQGQPGVRGWGIPMATDIAFVVGCMAVLGPRVPHGFRVLILSLAIADDIGAILVIAIGYTEQIHPGPLVLGLGMIVATLACQRLGVRSFGVYGVLGGIMWVGLHESGVHATIGGVVLGLLTPARSYIPGNAFARMLERAQRTILGGDWENEGHRAEKVRRFQHAARETISPLEFLEGSLHPWTSFLIMPVFALANAGVPFKPVVLADPVALAVAAGLVLGKPLGILGFSFVAVKAGLARMPAGVSWAVLAGGGLLAGIGFTMALFISELALDGPELVAAKVGILGASAVAAIAGMLLLLASLPRRRPDGD